MRTIVLGKIIVVANRNQHRSGDISYLLIVLVLAGHVRAICEQPRNVSVQRQLLVMDLKVQPNPQTKTTFMSAVIF
jgi:hypothetical protein